MTEDKILMALKESKFYSRLLSFNTVCIYCVGSRMVNVEYSGSDYDIAVVIDDEQIKSIDTKNNNEFLRTKDGKVVHWYYHDYNDLMSTEGIQNELAAIYPMFLNDDMVIDIFDNEKFNKLYEERERIFLKGAKELYKKYNVYIKELLSNYDKLRKSQSKTLYKICLVEFTLANMTIDTEFLKRVKGTCAGEVLCDDDLHMCFRLLSSFEQRFKEDI